MKIRIELDDVMTDAKLAEVVRAQLDKRFTAQYTRYTYTCGEFWEHICLQNKLAEFDPSSPCQ